MDTSLDVWFSPGNAAPETIGSWFQLLEDLFGVRAEIMYDYLGHQKQPCNNMRVKLVGTVNGELLEKAKDYLMDLCALEDQKPERHYHYSKAPCEHEDTTEEEPKEFRGKLQSEDSSYDSDYEASELTSPGEGRIEHEDVSRTVSDTLSAEFAEYVTCSQVQENESNPDPDNSTNFTSRLEFALKLGYTENQARVALHKLGPHPGQNELLAELIRLSSQGQSKGSPSTAGVDDCNAQLQGISQSNSAQTAGTVRSSTPSPQVPGAAFGEDGGASVFERSVRTRVDAGAEDGCHLRHVVIDGSNVAMSHGNKEQFSCRGIKLCVDWFKNRGHKEITVFVPRWRKEASRPDAPITDQEILLDLEKERKLVFTPSRFVGGRRINCYDDRYILKLAVEADGIVVSNDNYRDLVNENQEFKKVVEERLLMYSFVNDRFMPPEDPLGRHGPSLDNFLRKRPKPPETLPPLCPYGKKCTYGNKCKYYHPERGNQPQKSVTERLAEQAKSQIQEVKARSNKSRDSSPGDLRLKASLSLPVTSSATPSGEKSIRKMALTRTHSAVPPGSAGPAVTQQQTVPKEFVDHASGAWGHHHSQQLHAAGGGGALAGAGGGHLSVAKRLSDPDNHPKQTPANEGGNQHRKLQRQLTLGFEHDPRLGRMRNFINPHPQSVDPASCGGDAMLHQMQHQRTHLHPHLHPHYVGMEQQGHRPLTRHGSDQGRWGDPGQSQHPHQAVHRIASAPDSYAHGPGGSQQQRRLNSTSDTQLNAYHCDAQHSWLVPPPPATPQPAWQDCPGVPHPHADPQRFRIYYHLSSLFQPEQVKAAMMVHPEETDVQKICTTILTMFPMTQ